MKRFSLIDYNAPFCLNLAFICIGVFLAGVLSNGWLLAHVFSIPGQASFFDWTTYPRLFLHVLGHANTGHLFSNLMLLLLIGPMLEKIHGALTLLLISCITALVTGLLMVLFFPGLLLGASGIIFAFIVLSSFANARNGKIPLTFVIVSCVFVGAEIVRAMEGGSQIAYFAHIAGGAIGGLAGFAITANRRR